MFIRYVFTNHITPCLYVSVIKCRVSDIENFFLILNKNFVTFLRYVFIDHDGFGMVMSLLCTAQILLFFIPIKYISRFQYENNFFF